jgi:Tfp pilus assembly PilM family ATPase
MTITVGISFSPHACHAVTLKHHKKSFSYHHPRVVSHRFDNFAGLPEVISALNLPKKARVIVGIPAEKIMMRDFTLDADLSDAEILQYLKSRAIQLFGHDSDHLCLDYEKQTTNEAAKQTVNVVAAHQSMIQHIQTSFAEEKIDLHAIDIDSCAIARAQHHTAAQTFLSVEKMHTYTTAVGLCLWENA